MPQKFGRITRLSIEIKTSQVQFSATQSFWVKSRGQAGGGGAAQKVLNFLFGNLLACSPSISSMQCGGHLSLWCRLAWVLPMAVKWFCRSHPFVLCVLLAKVLTCKQDKYLPFGHGKYPQYSLESLLFRSPKYNPWLPVGHLLVPYPLPPNRNPYNPKTPKQGPFETQKPKPIPQNPDTRSPGSRNPD